MRYSKKNKTYANSFLLFGIFFITGLTGLRSTTDFITIESTADHLPSNISLPSLTDLNDLPTSLSFIIDSLCFIKDPVNSLSTFKSELYDLVSGKDTVINVVHLGDSHIQAGYLSGRTMRLLQSSFGNAGRGWIAPFKLSKVNEPSDYYILSNVKDWVAGRCIQLKPKCPWGIGGIGIQTKAKDVDFRLIITPTNGSGYSFNKILLFRDLTTTPMSPFGISANQVSERFEGAQPFETVMIDTFITAYLVDTFAIQSVKTQHPSISNLYYGFMLMNGNPGILYHSIGVNGARYTDYTKREYIRQLSLLKPSLLIISLGTNESFGRNFNNAIFEKQIHSLIQLIHEEIPSASIIITTPIETYKSVTVNKKRQYVRNENMAKVADVISSYTEREGLACLDMFAVSGGVNSCQNWFDAKMFGRDRIHFTRDAYEEQGALLYKAIARSCLFSDELQAPVDERLDVKMEEDEDTIIDLTDDKEAIIELNEAEEEVGHVE